MEKEDRIVSTKLCNPMDSSAPLQAFTERIEEPSWRASEAEGGESGIFIVCAPGTQMQMLQVMRAQPPEYR